MSVGGVLLRIFAVVLVVGGLGFVGWSAYGPVMEYLSGAMHASADIPTSSASSAVADSGAQNQEGAALDEQTASPAPAAIQAEIRAVYFPPSVITNSALLDEKLDLLEKTDYNALLFDLKDSNGRILYQSQRELTERTGAQVENAMDLQLFCEKLEERGILPIGRVSAFRDPIAPVKVTEAAVKYMDSDILWLDNSREEGGKPWLNPYSDLAQAYISDIASEAVSMGVSRIVLDDVSFPTGFGQEFASYGANPSNLTRSEILSNFVDVMDEQIKSLGAEMYLYIPATAALGANTTYYGTNPLTFANGRILLGVMPAQFGDEFSVDGFTLDKPVLEPYETVSAVLRQLAPDLAGMEVTAMLQGYNASYTVENNKVYTGQDVTKQVQALTEQNIGNYILYNPEGDYTNVT